MAFYCTFVFSLLRNQVITYTLPVRVNLLCYVFLVLPKSVSGITNQIGKTRKIHIASEA